MIEHELMKPSTIDPKFKAKYNFSERKPQDELELFEAPQGNFKSFFRA